MLKYLLFGALIYLGYKLYRGMTLISKKGRADMRRSEKDLYDKLDIRDADYEDVDEDDSDAESN